MKKEILRINNLNYIFSVRRKLENISLCILEGECIGFLGLSYSGKDLLVKILDGDIEENIYDFSIYIEGKRLKNVAELEKKIYKSNVSNYIIDNWTVAEYIGLVDSGWLISQATISGLMDEVSTYFYEMGVGFDVSRRMSSLTELEKRIVDIVKAYKSGAKIVVIEDEFEGMSLEEIYLFAREMKKMIQGKMSVIINSHSNEIISLLSEKYIIFNKGRIVKKCARGYIRSEEQLEKFLIGTNELSGKLSESAKVHEETQQKIIYQVHNIYFLDKKFWNLDFSKGEVTTLLALNRKKKERLFEVLSKRGKEEKVVAVKNIGTDMEIFSHMSVSDNLLLPSLDKLSGPEYVMSAQKIHKMLAGTVDLVNKKPGVMAGRLKINELISITLERWYIYNPKVLVLFEPFAMCDIKGVSIVKNYIKKFAGRGTAIIIIKTREEYVEDISDRILRIDE